MNNILFKQFGATYTKQGDYFLPNLILLAEEETGYICGKIEKLLALKSTVAFCNEFIDVYLATELTEGVQHLDEEEFIDVEAWKLSDLYEKIYAGEIQDAKTVAAILAYANKIKS